MRWLHEKTSPQDRLSAKELVASVAGSIGNGAIAAIDSQNVDGGILITAFVAKAGFDRTAIESLLSSLLSVEREVGVLPELPKPITIEEYLEQKAVTDDVERAITDGDA